MSKRILVTFSGERYHLPTEKIVKDGPCFGADQVLVYDDVWLKEKRPEHCAATKWAFDHTKCRGVNWFCFKPFVILDALKRCEDGDTVLFIDGDTWPIADMTPLYDMADRDGIVLFAACGHSQRHWSKRDTQIVMGMDSDYWRNKHAGVARFMLFKKGARTKRYKLSTPLKFSDMEQCSVDDFVQDWLIFTCHPMANTFDKSILAEEYADLKEARCEQAVLTNLAHRDGVPLHREADQWGNDFMKDYPNDTYPQIFYSTGEYSYAPGPRIPGSVFRNVND